MHRCHKPVGICSPAITCQRIPRGRIPWFVGGNNIEDLPPVEDNTLIFGIIDTEGPAVFENIAFRAGGGEVIFINGLQPEGTLYFSELSRRVEIQNGAIETAYVPIAVERVSDENGTQFTDWYFEVFSNAYTLDLTDADVTVIPANPALVANAVNINNIFLGTVPPNYPNNYAAYPTTGINSQIAPELNLRGELFDFTLLLNNTTGQPLNVTFTKTAPFAPVFVLKYTPTFVSFNIAPYVIPAGGSLMAHFRVEVLDDNITPEYKMVAPAMVYP